MSSERSGGEDLRAIARRAMLEHGLLPEFSSAALAEANALTGPAAASGSSVRDLRALPWASIDNDDSRDLDQLSVAQPASAGTVRILIAIADVDALVARGSAIDEHAGANTTSVYTAGGIFPMLPERLSTDLTSLAPGQERASVVIDMALDAAGTLVESDIYRAVVINRAQLAYRSVAAWLEGSTPPPPRLAAVPDLEGQLRLQDQVAQALKRKRREQGALELETNEAEGVFTGGSPPGQTHADTRNRAEELIENFMIAANAAGACFLAARGFPSLRRVLTPPERWDRIAALAAAAGETLPQQPDGPALSAFLLKRREADPARFPELSLSVVKLLGAAEYVLEMPGERTVGHFGLAVQDYTHSTAPNRRYPDLITQRLLKAALERRAVPYSVEALRTLAAHCTQQERSAARVERQVRKSAAALLLEPSLGQRFDAVVTGASDAGTWVRTLQPLVEGRVIHGYEGLDVGDRVSVKLVHVDVARGFIDFVRLR